MPRKPQKKVSIPEWVWDIAEKYYEENKEELRYQDITSTTKLIRTWILQATEDLEKSE